MKKLGFKDIMNLLIKGILSLLTNLICVSIGWDVLLRYAFKGIYEIPVLNVWQLILLSFAITFVMAPLGIYTKNLIKNELHK